MLIKLQMWRFDVTTTVEYFTSTRLWSTCGFVNNPERERGRVQCHVSKLKAAHEMSFPKCKQYMIFSNNYTYIYGGE